MSEYMTINELKYSKRSESEEEMWVVLLFGVIALCYWMNVLIQGEGGIRVL